MGHAGVALILEALGVRPWNEPGQKQALPIRDRVGDGEIHDYEQLPSAVKTAHHRGLRRLLQPLPGEVVGLVLFWDFLA